MAMSRRKRRREEETAWTEPYFSDEPVAELARETPPVAEEQPAVLAPALSTFAWGDAPSKEPESARGKSVETWVERAMHGPTPDNPSLSLKKRLKRAAFFDQREREVAAGEPVPVEADAGLPESLDEPERQLEAA